MDDSITGGELAELRHRLAFSQEALAAEVGVRPNTVARWERGEGRVPVAVAKLVGLLAGEGIAAPALRSARSTSRDPLHAKIIEVLNGPLDDAVLEDCAADMLQEIWPGLAPVPGGSDDGFDGSFPTDDADSFPLVVTGGRDPTGNLRRSLKRAIKQGWKPRRAIFATPRRITGKTRKNLRVIAAELGVVLVQVYEQAWFANALYRNSAWRKKLLDIVGAPSALSPIPKSDRPLIGDQVIGRESELDFLRRTDEDCVVAGPPGAGKTFLLRALAVEGTAHFVTTKDRGELADAIRELRPRVVVVDDAHLDLPFLTDLRHLRQEIGAHFHIVAVSWPADEPGVTKALGLGNGKVLHLESIDADTMVEIVRSVGLEGPTALLRSIVRQSEGRPGLATTLAYLCLRGEVEQVFSGESLVSQLIPTLDSLVARDTRRLLGAFSLAGDFGVKPEEAAMALGLAPVDVCDTLAKLGAAGVIRQHGDKRVSVWPKQMRWVLVKQTFFEAPGALPLNPLVEYCSSREAVLDTLLGARSRGALIPNLEDMLEVYASDSLWCGYAELGPNEVRLVLKRHPHLATNIADQGLRHCPEEIIPYLLAAAVDDGRAQHSFPEHPLRKLNEWGAGDPRYYDVVARRRITVSTTRAWMRAGNDRRTGLKALLQAMSPLFGTSETDPGRGMKVTITSGVLSGNQICDVFDLWPEIAGEIRASSVEDIPWQEAFAVVHDCLHPHIGAPIENALREKLKVCGSCILIDLVQVSRAHPGLQQRIAGVADIGEVHVDTTVSREFSVFYPTEGRRDYSTHSKDWERRAAELGKVWARRSARAAVSRIIAIEREASLAGLDFPRYTPHVCAAIAELTAEPLEWLKALLDAGQPTDLLHPFLCRVIREEESEALTLLGRMLEKEAYGNQCRGLAIATILTQSTVPEGLLDRAMADLEEFCDLVEISALRGDIPVERLDRLLRHQSLKISLAAARGLWAATDHGQVPSSLVSAWRTAVLRSAAHRESGAHDEHALEEILRADADLAAEWLMRFMTADEPIMSFFLGEIAREAATVLSKEQRIALMRQRWSRAPDQRLVRGLIGGDLDVYGHLLAEEGKRFHHLDALSSVPDGDWPEMAKMALRAGYSCDAVVKAALHGPVRWSGRESDMWIDWAGHFAELKKSADPDLARIGEMAGEQALEFAGEARRRERKRDVYGL